MLCRGSYLHCPRPQPCNHAPAVLAWLACMHRLAVPGGGWEIGLTRAAAIATATAAAAFLPGRPSPHSPGPPPPSPGRVVHLVR